MCDILAGSRDGHALYLNLLFAFFAGWAHRFSVKTSGTAFQALISGMSSLLSDISGTKVKIPTSFSSSVHEGPTAIFLCGNCRRTAFWMDSRSPSVCTCGASRVKTSTPPPADPASSAPVPAPKYVAPVKIAHGMRFQRILEVRHLSPAFQQATRRPDFDSSAPPPTAMKDIFDGKAYARIRTNNPGFFMAPDNKLIGLFADGIDLKPQGAGGGRSRRTSDCIGLSWEDMSADDRRSLENMDALVLSEKSLSADVMLALLKLYTEGELLDSYVEGHKVRVNTTFDARQSYALKLYYL